VHVVVVIIQVAVCIGLLRITRHERSVKASVNVFEEQVSSVSGS